MLKPKNMQMKHIVAGFLGVVRPCVGEIPNMGVAEAVGVVETWDFEKKIPFSPIYI